jgi:hypothetical protein
MVDTLRERVERVFTDAVDNHYAEQLRCMSAKQLAYDLMRHNEDLRSENVENIIPLAREWLGG